MECKSPYDLDTEEGRRELVLNTMGSFALEGMQPTAQAIADAQDYIAGRSTSAEIIERLNKRYGVA